MVPTKNAVQIEETLRNNPSRELFRSRCKTWDLEDVEYGYSCIEHDVVGSARGRVAELLDELREELRAKIASEQEERRHREALGSNFQAIKISRVALWVSIAAAISLVAWLFPRN